MAGPDFISFIRGPLKYVKAHTASRCTALTSVNLQTFNQASTIISPTLWDCPCGCPGIAHCDCDCVAVDVVVDVVGQGLQCILVSFAWYLVSAYTHLGRPYHIVYIYDGEFEEADLEPMTRAARTRRKRTMRHFHQRSCEIRHGLHRSGKFGEPKLCSRCRAKLGGGH